MDEKVFTHKDILDIEKRNEELDELIFLAVEAMEIASSDLPEHSYAKQVLEEALKKIHGREQMNEVQQNNEIMKTHLALYHVREDMKQCRKEREFYKAQMWICFIGWVVTAFVMVMI
jgi:hypothetical protein